MNVELLAALAGAVVGASVTGVLTYLQARLSFEYQSRAHRDHLRLDLVREIMRYRLDEERLIGPLNEIPMVFGDDRDVVSLYRATLDATGTPERTRALTGLINRLATLVGLPSTVDLADIGRGFQIRRVSENAEPSQD